MDFVNLLYSWKITPICCYQQIMDIRDILEEMSILALNPHKIPSIRRNKIIMWLLPQSSVSTPSLIGLYERTMEEKLPIRGYITQEIRDILKQQVINSDLKDSVIMDENYIQLDFVPLL